MPEPPPDSKRRPQLSQRAELVSGVTAVRYAELRCKTNFSFLEGASHADELVMRAAELGYTALAIADRNTLAGVVRAHVAAKSVGLKLLIGAEITLVDALPVVLLATDRAAYGRLCRLITTGRMRAEKGQCQLHWSDLVPQSEGLLACVVPEGPLTVEAVKRYRELFGDRAYLMADQLLGAGDRQRLAALKEIAAEADVPLVASNDVLYHVSARQPLQEVLTATRQQTTVAELGTTRLSNAERHLKSPVDMQTLFAICPEAIICTAEIADRCHFSLDELRYEYPEELSPTGLTPYQHLEQLVWSGAALRYPQSISDAVRRLIEHELALISELRYEAYFLTVWDLVRFARERGILCQGRGSAANSVVCFCLGVTEVDPERIDVLFERFISKERDEAPDIDIDFENARREEVIQYVYDKYGRERAGMTATVITYRIKSAVRDVGKALGLSMDCVDALAKGFERVDDEDRLAGRFREAGLNPQSRIARQLKALVTELIGFPRHLSQHVGGLVITHGPLCELVPIENASMPGRTVVEWDKDDLDALGILKVDCLALGMLTAIQKCFAMIRQRTGQPWTLATIPAEDPAIYEMCGRADTVGVFQIESRAQMSMLPRLKPKCFYDLVIEVAIVRPGPIQGDMVHPYLRRRSGEEPVQYPDERVRSVLHKTLGIPLFQEQAMRLVVVCGGFTPGEADQLRRAMGAWRKTGVIDKFREKLIAGMLANGYSRDFAERLFNQIRGFGEYGFPESHAASFALLVYASLWLKRYHPAAFCAALLNSQPMGFYAPAQLVQDARKHGVEVLPVDVNASGWECSLEGSEVDSPALRLGLRMIAGVGEAVGRRIAEARQTKPFTSQADLARRANLTQPILERLASADACGSLGQSRRTAQWEALRPPVQRSLFADLPDDEESVSLPTMAPFRDVVEDYRSIGLSLKAHPLSFLRPQLDALRVAPASRLPTLKHGCKLWVGGIVLMRQRPSTAKGITFVTLEDETGQTNLIVRPEVWERFHQVACRSSAMRVFGQLQNMHGVIHVLASRLCDLSRDLAALQTVSRDFR